MPSSPSGPWRPPRLDVLGRRLREDASALLRHECAYVLGQLRDPTCIPHLREALAGNPAPMVPNEAVESLGNIATDE